MFSVLSKRLCVRSVQKFTSVTSALNCSTKKPTDNKSANSPDVILGSISTKYQVFRNEDSTVIFDVNEEKFAQLSSIEPLSETQDEYEGLNLERGVRGVYEIEDLVEVLKRENAQNIAAISVPQELKYVDYICIVSGRSFRHMLAIAEFVRKLFKIKRNSRDVIPRIEGENSREWIAIDLGNIALHIFSKEARIKYDLDSLWSLGEEFDDESNKPDDPIVQLLQKHSVYLRELEPANSDI